MLLLTELQSTQVTSTTNQLWGAGVFALIILIEFLASLKTERELYEPKDAAASITMGLVAYFLAFTVTKAGSYWVFWQIYDACNPIVDGARMNWMGYEAFSQAWYVFLICQVLDDHNYYWYHRLSHTVRVLWAAHIVHHSSDKFNYGTGVRNGWVTLFYKPLFWLWLPAIGFHPNVVVTCLLIQAVWQFQLHTQFVPYLGFLEKFMNTHKQHQVHHAQNIDYLDKNHGGYLNLFDRLYGSHGELDPNQQVRFGVVHPPKTNNPLDIVSHEYVAIWRDVKKSKNLKEAFMYIFGPPGWSPDGSSYTVKQIQREFNKMKEENKDVPVSELEKRLLHKA